MTYRRLTNDELSELETAFARFLAVNGIPADDWVKIKAEDYKRTEELIESFSDVVFHETLSKVEYLDFKTKKEIRTFHCSKEKIILRGITVEGETALDFTEDEDSKLMLTKMQASGAKLSIYVTEKKYKDDKREMELFTMMESGCLISDGSLFKLLESITK
ncbi:MAG: hypothetical protein ACI8YQ_000573 [Polaribacter sp.]|jgi:hypothetical protein